MCRAGGGWKPLLELLKIQHSTGGQRKPHLPKSLQHFSLCHLVSSDSLWHSGPLQVPFRRMVPVEAPISSTSTGSKEKLLSSLVPAQGGNTAGHQAVMAWPHAPGMGICPPKKSKGRFPCLYVKPSRVHPSCNMSPLCKHAPCSRSAVPDADLGTSRRILTLVQGSSLLRRGNTFELRGK